MNKFILKGKIIMKRETLGCIKLFFFVKILSEIWRYPEEAKETKRSATVIRLSQRLRDPVVQALSLMRLRLNLSLKRNL